MDGIIDMKSPNVPGLCDTRMILPTPALSKRSHPQASAGFSYRAVNNGSHQEEGPLTGRVNVKRWRQV